jgi:hypothetical protein
MQNARYFFFFRFWQKLEFFYCSFSVQNLIELRSAVFEVLHATRQADKMEERTRAFFKLHCELTKKRESRGVNNWKLVHKIYSFYTSDYFRYGRGLTACVRRTIIPTQRDTCKTSICGDMTSRIHCGYHRVLENLTHNRPVQKPPRFTKHGGSSSCL